MSELIAEMDKQIYELSIVNEDMILARKHFPFCKQIRVGSYRGGTA